MAFPPQLWFGGGGGRDRVPEEALLAAPADATNRALLREAARLGPEDRELLLRVARQIRPSPEDG